MDFQNFFTSLLHILNEMSPYILLGFLIAGFLHVFIRPEQMTRHLSGKGWRPVVKAALVGIPLPLCSCGVLPTAIALRRQGASNGATTSFLISTPQTGVDSIAATYALLGLPFAIMRPIAALVGSFAGGMAVDRTDTVQPVAHTISIAHTAPDRSASLIRKIIETVRYGLVDMVASVGKWLVIGLVIAAIITVAVPDTLFLSLSKYPILAMIVMVMIAVPMYICATGSIPIALSLMLKGLTPGVAFVLLMAGPAANFASVILLRKNLGKRATVIYVASVILTAIAFGLIIDYLLPQSWFAIGNSSMAAGSCHTTFNPFQLACTALLVILLVYAMIRTYIAPHRHTHQHTAPDSNHNNENPNNKNHKIMPTATYKVEGMACAHCKATVEKALSALPGVASATADLINHTATISSATGTSLPAPEEVAAAISNAGFTCHLP